LRTGQIKNYNNGKKYGFIRADDGKNIFFHRDVVRPRLSWIGSGQRIEFEDAWSEEHGNPRATVVRVSN